MATLLSPFSPALLLPTALLARSGCQRLIDVTAALAWLNLVDAKLKASDEGKTTAAYKTFLELAPKQATAAEVRGWIAAPSDRTRPKAL